MNLKKIRETVIEVIENYLETQDINGKANEETVLFGKDSILDSMGLVNIIIDIESKFLDEDIEISLTSEKAMSRRNSPFRTVNTLTDYIVEQIEENNE